MQFISCIFRTKTPLQQRVTIATGVVRRGNSAETWNNKRAIVAVVAKNNTVGNCAVVRAPFPLVTSRQAAVITHTSCLSLPETCWPPQLARKMPSVAEKPEVCRGVFNHGHLLVSARRDCSGLSGKRWRVGDALTTMRRVNRRRVGVVCVARNVPRSSDTVGAITKRCTISYNPLHVLVELVGLPREGVGTIVPTQGRFMQVVP